MVTQRSTTSLAQSASSSSDHRCLRAGAHRLDQRHLRRVLPDPCEHRAAVRADGFALTRGQFCVEHVEQLLDIRRHRHGVGFGHDHRALDQRGDIAPGVPRHPTRDLLQRFDQFARHLTDRLRSPVAVGDVIVGLEHQEAGEAAVDHRALLERRPEQLRHGGGVDAAAGLGDVLAWPLVLIGVLGAEEGAAGAGVELGQQVPDLSEVFRRVTLVDDAARGTARTRRSGTGWTADGRGRSAGPSRRRCGCRRGSVAVPQR